MGSTILVWFLVGDVPLRIFAFPLAPFDLVEGVMMARCLVRSGGALSHGSIWCV
jgi:hypothetical protein